MIYLYECEFLSYLEFDVMKCLFFYHDQTLRLMIEEWENSCMYLFVCPCVDHAYVDNVLFWIIEILDEYTMIDLL